MSSRSTKSPAYEQIRDAYHDLSMPGAMQLIDVMNALGRIGTFPVVHIERERKNRDIHYEVQFFIAPSPQAAAEVGDVHGFVVLKKLAQALKWMKEAKRNQLDEVLLKSSLLVSEHYFKCKPKVLLN